jgi:hypothetical protein
MSTDICKNVKNVKKAIEKACAISKRDPDKVTLVTVTKTVGPVEMKQALACGCRDFGENRVQDFLEKHELFGDKARFHMIGHLQTNKVKYIVGKACLIHSVDSPHLLREIEKRAASADVVQDVLLQLDISGEEGKFGAGLDEMHCMIEENENNKHVRIRGLMTMAPFEEDPERVRWVFRKLRNVLVDTGKKTFYNTNMEYTSMGMSNDFKVAVEEGADIVRVGSAIFRGFYEG